MNIFHDAIRAVRRSGILNTIRMVQYALKRDWLERNYPQIKTGSVRFEEPGNLVSHEHSQSEFKFQFQNMRLWVRFLAADLVRISWNARNNPIPYAITMTNWPDFTAQISRVPQGWEISSQELSVRIDLYGAVTFSDVEGRVLRVELPPIREGESWTHHSVMEPDLHIFGLGERAGGFNLRGADYCLWNSDPRGGYAPGDDPLYLNIPVFLGLHSAGCYLVFYENPYKASFSFRADSEFPNTHRTGFTEAISAARFEGGHLRYYYIPGPPGRAIERYTQLTGRPDLPPRWSLGYHQSRWGYRSAHDIRTVAREFARHDLPINAIHLDIDYMDDFRVFTVDTDRFPDLAGLARELNEHGIQLVAILNPGVKYDRAYSLYLDGLAKGAFCTLPNGKAIIAPVWPGWSLFPDFTDPQVRSWWGTQYSTLLDQGIAGIWHDMNEPCAFAAWGDLTLPLSTCHSLDGNSGDHRQAHNLYGLLMNRAGYEAIRKLRPERRPWLLTRSGWAGVGRYSWHWTADIDTSWAALRQTVKTILGLGLSGIPFTGSDIGGFLGDPSEELYLRWFQLAAFTPFFRTHSSIETQPREPWRFGEPTLSYLRESLRLRNKLMPYFYTLAWEASQKGTPLVRPLFWAYPEERTLWDVDDVFLIGDDLLVAPVLEEGATSRQIRLPPGGWFNFWDDTMVQGPGDLEISCTPATIPVLARAGSLIPLQADEFIELHLYLLPRTSGFAQLYSDSGDGYGPWRLDRFQLTSSSSSFKLTRQTDGDFPFPYQCFRLCFHGFSAKTAWLNGHETYCESDHIILDQFTQVRVEGTFSTHKTSQS